MRGKATALPLDQLRRLIELEADLSPEDAELVDELRALRPRNRTECAGGERPCPWVSCRYHLYLEVTEAGSIRIAHPGLEPWELAETCALDLVDREPDGVTLGIVGALLNLTRERTRQVQETALTHMAAGQPRPARRRRTRKGRRGPHYGDEVRDAAMVALVADAAPLDDVHQSTGVPLRTLRDWRDGRTRWAARRRARLELTRTGAHVTGGEEEDRHG